MPVRDVTLTEMSTVQGVTCRAASSVQAVTLTVTSEARDVALQPAPTTALWWQRNFIQLVQRWIQ